MEKILIPFEAQYTPFYGLSLVSKIAKKNEVVVHCIFLEETSEGVRFEYPFPNDMPLTEEIVSLDDVATQNNRLIDDKIKLFKDTCEIEGIEYEVEKDISIEQFLEGTSPTDLLVTDTKAEFLEEILPRLNCPAYVASNSELPGKVVLLYDGSESCQHAIKMYTSFFPEWRNFPTTVVSINISENQYDEIESYIQIELQPQFSNLGIQNLQGNKQKELISFLDQHTHPVLVVMGAFGRNAVSRFFRESLANVIMENTGCSLFIAHK